MRTPGFCATGARNNGGDIGWEFTMMGQAGFLVAEWIQVSEGYGVFSDD